MQNLPNCPVLTIEAIKLLFDLRQLRRWRIDEKRGYQKQVLDVVKRTIRIASEITRSCQVANGSAGITRWPPQCRPRKTGRIASRT